MSSRWLVGLTPVALRAPSVSPTTLLPPQPIKGIQTQKHSKHLNERRHQLENLFSKTLTELSKAIDEGSYSTDKLVHLASYQMSEPLRKAIFVMLDCEDKTEESMSKHYATISILMEGDIALINKKIDDLVS